MAGSVFGKGDGKGVGKVRPLKMLLGTENRKVNEKKKQSPSLEGQVYIFS